MSQPIIHPIEGYQERERERNRRRRKRIDARAQRLIDKACQYVEGGSEDEYYRYLLGDATTKNVLQTALTLLVGVAKEKYERERNKG